ncbi:hypothetical protein P0R31_14320 [Bradyrhizobium yuanmingense]|uniref:hypothetical protein n=1 Tax=Bradyrhizobium yuanmingense TaxID=108015 RepID=UPI0023B8D95B|nr:hypothetical protein [Bradyrhizobium yuanmingense]MDF0518409.1 hypothetical protein [Bradyrhizobium yuanmingense]
MKRLILMTDSSAAGAIQRAGLADLVIAIERRLVWGSLPSTAELDAFWRLEGSGPHGLIELFLEYDTVELWMEPEPNAQLILLWLLDHCGSDRAAASKLVMRPLDIAVSGLGPEGLAKPNPPLVRLTQDHVGLAGRAWRAYRAPTPQAWFDLLDMDLRLLPQLERCVLDLLEELPNVTSGLGATEMRVLELIAPGGVQPFEVFPGYQKPNGCRVFNYWEVGALLDGLARCPVPAVSGLEEGPFTLDMHDDALRHARYKQSRLSLTDLGKAILAGDEDFCRHNPLRRWWGGTLLANERLWRWDDERRLLVAP